MSTEPPDKPLWYDQVQPAMTEKHAPATLRNRDAIVAVLKDILPASGLILEVASGTGEHIVYFGRSFPDLMFQPSDPDPACRESIAAWTQREAVANVLPPLPLDAQQAALLRLSLDNSLQQAQLALLQARPQVYQAALDQADALIRNRFDASEARARHLLSSMNELRQQAVAQALPEIGAGLAAIRALKMGPQQ